MRDQSSFSVVLRSLQWPGFFFYHKQESKKFGSVYMGEGLKNDELTFMI